MSLAVGPKVIQGIAEIVGVIDSFENHKISPEFKPVRLRKKNPKVIRMPEQVVIPELMPAQIPELQSAVASSSSAIHLVEFCLNSPLLSLTVYKKGKPSQQGL